jgi:hypothetical protein
MKLVKVQIELIIDESVGSDKESVSTYLNHKLYTDPEFFGDFWTENIIEVEEVNDYCY